MANTKKDSKKSSAMDQTKKKKDSKKSSALGQTKTKKDSKKGLAPHRIQKTRQLPTMWSGDVLGQKFLPTWFSGDNALWTPPINVVEKEDRFVAKVELPGVNEEDIGLSIIGDKLIVQGEKEAESEVKRKGYSYRETSYGSFSRSITIPSIVNADWITANFDKGVLEIDLPKIVGVQPKKINVKSKNKQNPNAKETKAVSSKLETNSHGKGEIQSKKANVTATEKAKAIAKGIQTAPSAPKSPAPTIVDTQPKKADMTVTENVKAIGKGTGATPGANAKPGPLEG